LSTEFQPVFFGKMPMTIPRVSEISHDLLAIKMESPAVNLPVLSRINLIDLLTKSMNVQVTLVTAPTGYGKTTLLSEWLRVSNQKDRLNTWVSLDSNDNSIMRFWSYIIASILKAYPKFNFNTQKYLRSDYDSGDQSTLNPLINEIGMIPAKINLILDDFQTIKNPDIHSGMEYLIGHQPQNLHLTILSRISLPFPISRLRAQEQLIEINAADLSLSLDETRNFLTEIRGMNLSPSQVSRLHAATEGWIAGLKLVSLSLKDKSQFHIAHGGITENNPQLLEYLTEEVLNQQDETISDFLLKTSIFSELNPEFCDSVLDKTNSQKLIEEIDLRKLFLVPIDQNHYWYRYQSLFRRNMAILLQRKQPEIIPELHRKASAWLEQHGYPDKAVIQALAIDDFDTAARILDDWSMTAIKNLDLASLVNWISTIPEEFFRKYPRLGINYALACHMIFRPEKGDGTLSLAEKTLTAEIEKNPRDRNLQESLWRINAIRLIRKRMQEKNREIIYQIEDCINHAPENDTDFYGLLNHSLAEAYETINDYEPAAKAYQSALSFSLENNLHIEYIHSLSGLARIRKIQGNLSEAESLYRQGLEFYEKHNLDMSARTYLLTGLIDVDIDRDDAGKDAPYVQEIVGSYEAIEAGNLPTHYFSLLTYRLIRYFLCIHDYNRAEYYYRHILKHDAGFIFLFDFYEQLLIQVDFERDGNNFKNLPAEHQLLIQKLKELEHPQPVQMVPLAGLALARKRMDDTLNILRQAIPLYSAEGAKDLLLQAQVMLAETLLLQDDIPHAIEVLLGAVHLASKEGYLYIFLNKGETLNQALIQLESILEDHHPDKPFVERLVYAQAYALPQETGVQAPVGPFVTYSDISLSERENQVLELLAAGKTAKEISAILIVSKNTAKAHIKNIYKKFGEHSRTSVIQKALALHLIPYPDKNKRY
jgi:LuxR family transcriptional regulator, maltose regulon positive regulatory protein